MAAKYRLHAFDSKLDISVNSAGLFLSGKRYVDSVSYVNSVIFLDIESVL